MVIDLCSLWNRDHAILRMESIVGQTWLLCGEKDVESWKVALLCLFWTIWKEKNGRTIENIEKAQETIKQYFMFNF